MVRFCGFLTFRCSDLMTTLTYVLINNFCPFLCNISNCPANIFLRKNCFIIWWRSKKIILLFCLDNLKTRTKVVHKNVTKLCLHDISIHTNFHQKYTRMILVERWSYMTFGDPTHTSFNKKNWVFILLVFIEIFYQNRFINKCARKKNKENSRVMGSHSHRAFVVSYRRTYILKRQLFIISHKRKYL